MSKEHSLHRSVSFTDTDPLSSYFNFPTSQTIKITMSQPVQNGQTNVNNHLHKLNQRRHQIHPRHALKVIAAGSVTHLTCLALMAEVFALVPFIVAYAAPYWMQASDPMGLTYSGLWRLCAYTNCELFAGHPMHTWFHTVQVCSSLALVCQLLSFTLTCIYAFSSGCYRFKPHLIWSATTALIIADLFQLSSVVLYGVYQGSDPGTLSWAFILATLCTGFTILPVLFLVFEALQLLRRKPKKRPVLQRSVSEASIITKEVPTSNTESTRQSNQETSSDQKHIQRDSLVRMRVNSCSTLLSDPSDLPGCHDNSVLDNSVFD